MRLCALLCFIFVFVVGLVPNSDWIPELYSFTVSCIFFAAVISISDKHIRYLYFAVVLTLLTWVSTYFKFDFIVHANSIITIVFFVYIIVVSIIRIATSKEVGKLEFLRFEEGCPLPEELQTMCHTAFIVDDLAEAMKGYKVILEPFNVTETLQCAFIMDDKALIELMQVS